MGSVCNAAVARLGGQCEQSPDRGFTGRLELALGVRRLVHGDLEVVYQLDAQDDPGRGLIFL